MTGHREEPAPGTADLGHECVEPAVGAGIWQLDDPETAPALREALLAHVQICARCRLERAVLREVGDGLERASLHLRGTAARRRSRRWAAPTACVALAASLALTILLPPVGRRPDGVTRGDDRPDFERPVPGEVLVTAEPTLRWQPVPGASSYRVHLKQVDGAFTWVGATTGPSLRVPASAGLPGGAALSAWLEVVPSDLEAPGAIHVSFRRGTWPQFLRYRAGAAPLAARLCLAAGLATGVFALWRRTA